MSGSQVLAFFKDLRDVNVHVEPVKVLTNINLEITERLHIVDSLRIEMSDAAGNLIYDPPVETEASQGPTAPNSSSKIYIRYKFIDWPGPEDVLTICQTYLDELERFVADGQSKGILTK